MARSKFPSQKCKKTGRFGALFDVPMSFCVAGARDGAPRQNGAKRESFVASFHYNYHYTTFPSATLHHTTTAVPTATTPTTPTTTTTITTTTTHYTTLHCTSLHFTALHCTTLHYAPLHHTACYTDYTTLVTTMHSVQLQPQPRLQLHYFTLHYATLP